tara:strand:+ start:618 stop:779 length:162 start_codon:yes stop_codon:yes gene_type:complete
MNVLGIYRQLTIVVAILAVHHLAVNTQILDVVGNGAGVVGEITVVLVKEEDFK